MNILPVLLFQRIGQAQHEEKEEHHYDSHLYPLCSRRFTQVYQEIHQVRYILVVFSFESVPGLSIFSSFTSCLPPWPSSTMLTATVCSPCNSIKHMRHGDLVEQQVVPAGGGGFIAIELAKIGV